MIGHQVKVSGGLVSIIPVFLKKTGTLMCFSPEGKRNQQVASTEAGVTEEASTWKSEGHP